MRRIALVLAFAFFLLGIGGCEAGSITYDSGSNTIKVVGFNESSPCTFEDIYQADVANGWGVVSKQGDNQYEFRCKLQIGDGTNETWLIDANKAISHTIDDNFINITPNGYFRCGVIVDEINRTTKDGCFIYTTSSNKWVIEFTDTATLELFSTTISAESSTIIFQHSPANAHHKIWNCNFIHTKCYGIPALVDFYRVNWQSSLAGPRFTHTFADDIRITNCTYGLQLYTIHTPVTIKNYEMIGEDYSFRCIKLNANLYAVNVKCKWKVSWALTNDGKIYRQYTFTLKVVDENGNPISGAKVSVYNRSGCLEFEDITDANGRISTHTITRGYYDQAHGSTLVDFSPHTLVIEKEGYDTYKTQFTPTKAIEAIDWQISLKKVYVIEMVEEGRKGKSDIGEGLVLGFGFGIVLFAITLFVIKGGGRE
ncbi:MAG: carboxypeptidase-like regulatory domain-containing protein [Candidatus Thorarchaeota archaeon]